MAIITISREMGTGALQIATRMLVVIVAIQGLNSSVDIASVAGLLERAGMHGLGLVASPAVVASFDLARFTIS